MNRTIKDIQIEWENYLRRSRLSYVTSSLLAFYEVLEEIVPVKGEVRWLGYSTTYVLHFTHRKNAQITYKITYRHYNDLVFKKQKQQVCKFSLYSQTGYFFGKKQPMASIRSIMEELIGIIEELSKRIK